MKTGFEELKKHLIIRKYRNGDEKQIVPLLKIIFGEDKYKNNAYWNWMYLNNNYMKFSNIWVAEYAGEIIAHYGLMPVRMAINGNRYWGGQAINLAVDKNYRSRGIFSSLINKGNEVLSKEGIDFTYVLPNSNSFPIFNKHLAWNTFKNYCTLVYFLKLKNLNHYAYKKLAIPSDALDSCSRISIREIKSFDYRFDILSNSFLKTHAIMTYRGKRYLNWRYKENTIFKYNIYIAEEEDTLLGYIITTVRNLSYNIRNGIIVDIVSINSNINITNMLFEMALKSFIDQGVDIVSCNLSNKLYINLFKKIGFIQSPIRITSRILFKFNKNLYSGTDLDWFVTQGDSNVI